MARHRGPLGCLLVGAFALVPHLAEAQATKAGVVTALSGQAAVARTTAPQPLALRFKDDVFFRDRVSTERDSIVRLLLRGKAVVTIRELSEFSIVEEPNRAVVNLGFGRIALQVLRRLLSPGETVEIHTPNAIAAVRGSYLDSYCPRPAAGAAIQCDFTTLAVSEPVRISSLTDPSVFTLLASNQSTSVFDIGGITRFGPTINISPDQVREIRGLSQVPGQSVQNAQPPGNLLAGIGTAGLDQATALAGVLNTGGGGVTFTDLVAPTPPPPSPPNTSNLSVNQQTATVAAPAVTPSPSPTPSVFQLNTLPLVTFSEGLFNYSGAPINKAVITFPLASATPFFRFALDNLTIAGTFGSFTTTYSEVPPGLVPVNGLTFKGVTYGFTVSGAPSADANFGSGGPGTITYVQDPSLEGNAAGTLTLTFFQKVSSVSFGLALSTMLPVSPGAAVTLSDPPDAALPFYAFPKGSIVPLQSPLLDNPLTPETILGSVAQIQGQLIVFPSVGPLVSLTGAPHHLATAPGASMFDLMGSATAPEVVEGSTLTLGTDRPLHGGSAGSPAPLSAPLVQTVGATVDTEKVVTLDRALLEASAPLLNLTAGSIVTSDGNVLNLVQNAKLVGNVPADALIKLSASTLSVYNGALVNLAGGSFASVTGNLVSLANGSTLNVLNGALVSVSGGSFFRLAGGSLVMFGAGTNTLNLTNTAPLCAGCTINTAILGGYPVLLANGATAGNVTVAQGFRPFTGLGPTNRVNVTGASGAVLAVSGAASRVVLRP